MAILFWISEPRNG